MKAFYVCLAVLFLSIPALLLIHSRGEAKLKSVFSADPASLPFTVVLDAGHGGEDGGAVAPDGTNEKEINLAIANMIADYFELFGVRYVSVRKTDTAVGDLSLGTVRERKTSDIKARYALVNKTENAVLLSIHQNQFSVEKYYGTQVFFAPGDVVSEQIARSIQQCVITNLQPENSREVKPSGDSIYLLYHAKRPSVLVECGFLSNPAELSKLKNDTYRSQLAFFIIEGFLNGLKQLRTS